MIEEICSPQASGKEVELEEEEGEKEGEEEGEKRAVRIPNIQFDEF